MFLFLRKWRNSQESVWTAACTSTASSDLVSRRVIYERAFCLELDSRGVRFETERPILVRYKSWEIPGQKVDLLVAGVVLVEIKAVPKLKQIHTHQILSYLKTLDLRLGLLMNFKQRLLRDGLKRVVR
jgi:GxxExxY protein